MHSSLQPDSDALERRFRMVHLPGGGHRAAHESLSRPAQGDIERAGYFALGSEVPPECARQRPNNFPQQYVLDAALDNLDHGASECETLPNIDLIVMDWSVKPPRLLYDA
jgi:hypothetical protein